jgi:Ca2+-binding RTX toxin-like protein
MLHEIGHALGLKHPLDTVFSGTVTHDQTLDASLDNTANTVMCYTGAAPTALGAYDIAAIQHIYGTNAQDGTQVQSFSWNAGTSTLTQTGFAASGNVMLGISTADIMTGGNLSDRLVGFSGNDRLDGGLGSDTLRGGLGSDGLTGGNAATTGGDGASDTFVFNTLTDMTIRDGIYDFEVGATNDLIALEGTGLGLGALSASRFFTTGQTVGISGPVVIYDQPSGFLSYDRFDGGTGASTIFAVMFNHAALTASSFVVL